MSYHFAAHYARLPLGPNASRWIETEQHELIHGPDDAYACVRIESSLGGEADREMLQVLSGAGGAAMYLCVQANIGSFEYQHWTDGARQRGLSFLPESGWTVVEGEPEPWEAGCFFADSAELALYLDDLTRRWEPGEALEKETTRLKQIWADARIESGLPLPFADEVRATDTIAKYYGVCLFP